MTPTDLDLLRDYAEKHSESAFAALVQRHLNLVYSAALRQVRSPQLAEEVAQSAFADLARAAGKLKPGTILTAWLYEVARRTAIDVIRREARRQLREQIATEMNAANATASDWTHIEPLLDDAMHALDGIDRAAVLLRYFENKSLREVGAALGTSDDAAQKRVTRAVERLREYFAKHGVTSGAAGLAVILSANAVQAAPLGLTVTISTAAVLTGTTITTAATSTATIATHAVATTMNWLNLKSIAATVVAATLAGTSTYLVQQREATRLRAENQNLIAEKEKLTDERDATLTAMAANKVEIKRLQENQTELLRLRAEATRLRNEVQTTAVTRTAAPKPAPLTTNDDSLKPFTTTLTARVGDKQTLLTGGCGQMTPGKRMFLLTTPTILTVQNGQTEVLISTLVMEIREDLLAQFGMDKFKSDGRESSIQNLLGSAEGAELINVLRGTEGVTILGEPRMQTSNGVKAGLSMGNQDTNRLTASYGVGITPNITTDGKAMDLSVEAEIDPPGFSPSTSH